MFLAFVLFLLNLIACVHQVLPTVPTTQTTVGYTQVATTVYGTCAIRVDGTLRCWGREPISQVPEGKFTWVARAGIGACAVDANHQINCWAKAQNYLPPGDYSQVVGSDDNLCGITTTNDLVCWHKEFEEAPRPVNSQPAGKYRQVVVGDYNICAITTGNELRCWGANINLEGTENILDVDLDDGLNGSCIMCAVQGENHQLACFLPGAGPKEVRRVMWPPVVDVSVSLESGASPKFCAITQDSRLLCEGSEILASDGIPLSQVSVSMRHVCALTQSGGIVCGGSDIGGRTAGVAYEGVPMNPQ